MSFWPWQASPTIWIYSACVHMLMTRFLRRSLTVGIAAFFAPAVFSNDLAPQDGATAPESVIICTNMVSGASWQIRINFAKNTVDSNPARIRSDEIAWQDRADGGNYTLDRKSGELAAVFASSTGGYFIHSRCSPQT